MKKYIYLLMVMFMALVSVGFASCGSDDDDEPKGSDIVGTWQVKHDNETTLLQFTKGGIFNEVDIVSEEGVPDLFFYHGTYTVSGNKLTITYVFAYESEVVDCTYSVNGNRLTITNNEGTQTLSRVEDSVIEQYL